MRRDSNRFAAQDFVCSGDDGLAPAGMTMRVRREPCLSSLALLPGIITWTRYQVLLSRIQATKLTEKGWCFRDFNVENHLKKTSQSLWKKDLLKTDGRSAS